MLSINTKYNTMVMKITVEVLCNHSFPINILGNLISPTDAVRNLGVWFDSDFSFSFHVIKVHKACFAHVWDLKRLRGHLTVTLYSEVSQL